MRVFNIAVLTLSLAAFGMGSHRRHTRQASGQPGQFDFYVLVLSWSPEFCYSHPNAAECSEHKGFIVHGLWPQNSDGTFPLNCETSQPAPTNLDSISDIMPREIVRHEWLAHGTCSGLNGDQYFSMIRHLYSSIRVPDRLKQPSRSSTMSTRELKHEFEETNPQLHDDQMTINLRGNYLNAVEFCESKNASPAPVSCSGIHDTRQGTFVLPPVR